MLGTLVLAVLAADPSYPADPFAEEYSAPVSNEVGVGAGQVRPMLLVGVAGLSPDLSVRGTFEYTTLAYFGLRWSLEAQLTRFVDLPQPASARAGIGLHLLPYRRVDLGLFFEAGPALTDLAGQPRLTPMLVGGLGLEVAISELIYYRLEAQVAWASYEKAGAPATRAVPMAAKPEAAMRNASRRRRPGRLEMRLLSAWGSLSTVVSSTNFGDYCMQ